MYYKRYFFYSVAEKYMMIPLKKRKLKERMSGLKKEGGKGGVT